MALAGAGLLSMIGMVFGLGIYLIPTIIAVTRKPVNMAAAILVNILLGWSFIGWVVALVLALGAKQHINPYHYYAQPGVYQQGYSVPVRHYSLLPEQAPNQPTWGTPSAQQHGYPSTVSDAPYGAVESNGSPHPYGTPPPPA